MRKNRKHSKGFKYNRKHNRRRNGGIVVRRNGGIVVRRNRRRNPSGKGKLMAMAGTVALLGVVGLALAHYLGFANVSIVKL